MAEEPPGARDEAAGATEIRAFLIADVRGYTLFTQERGDEAAAKLAKKFAQVAREGVEARGGSVIELRGDEALAVFGSPRQAIRAAVELQDRFVEETISDPSLPLTVGIGLDAGEAVPVEGGYRGGALNQAARLCSLAGPGEVLASQEVAHLARRVEGIRYEDRGEVSLKGMAQPVRVMRLVSEAGDAASRLAPFAPPRVPEPVAARRGPLRRRLSALAVALALLVAGIAVPLTLLGGEGEVRPGPDSIGAVDPGSGKVVAGIEVGAGPGEIAIGGGALWVTHAAEDMVSRIDLDTRSVVDTVEVGSSPAGVAVTRDAVWVANGGDGTVSRISPATNEVVDTIRVGNGPAGVTVAFDAVWVVSSIDGTLSRIDPGTGDVRSAYVADGPTGVAAGAGSLWVSNTAGATVSRVDPETLAVTQPVGVGNGPAGVAVGEGAAWVANSLDGTVSRIDEASTAVTAVTVDAGPSGVAVGGGFVWVANEFAGTLSRIDPAGGPVRSIRVGHAPAALVAANGLLWVGIGAAAESHRGGTFRVISEESPATIDPHIAYGGQEWSVLALTNDGLVGWRRVGGAEGSLLVPDLATSLPTPTGGGKVYTFRLRSRIRYSTGEVVRPEDFRRGIERFLTIPKPPGAEPPTFYYAGIVGAASCTKDDCDLSEGIATGRDTITFTLVRPDPEFLYKLALPFAFPVPEGLPDRDVGTDPVPATGPYMVESFVPEESIVLARNPEFREWSRLAQPDGFPDRIEWRGEADLEEQADAVASGDADWADWALVAPSSLDELKTRYPAQVHTYILTATLFMSLNTTLPPFDDVRVRRALNFAVDREKVIELFGGEDRARVTCQVLPPNFPGYRPYCPYTDEPTPSGAWSGPDLGRARALVEESGTAGSRVVLLAVAAPDPPRNREIGRYFLSILRDLGYRAEVRTMKDVERYFAAIYAPDSTVQIGMSGWIQDYPAASNFIKDQFECGAGASTTGFCDPATDRLIDRALALQATDPPRSRALWAELDRRIVDAAPWVSLSNPVGIDFLSERVGNYQRHPQWGLLLDQLWVT